MPLLAWVVITWIVWVTGPTFHHVDPGPSVPPEWMKVSLIALQAVIASCALAAVVFYVLRPLWRERRFSTDGLLTLAFFVMWFQDPISNWKGVWFAYNSTLVNMGSWGSLVPGWHVVTHPGADPTEPLLLAGGFYICGWLHIAKLGSRLLTWSKARWPRLGDVGACLLVLLPAMMLLDIVMEALIFSALGAYSLPSGVGPVLFPHAYNRWPMVTALLSGVNFAIFAAWIHYRNDQGELWCERGISRLRAGRRTKTFARFLSYVAFTQVVLFLFYAVPSAFLLSANPTPWPDSIQSKSYFTDHLCGAGTFVICGTPGVPIDGSNDQIHIGPQGQLVVPANSAAAKLYHLRPGQSLTVPVPRQNRPRAIKSDNKLQAPYSGPIFGWG